MNNETSLYNKKRNQTKKITGIFNIRDKFDAINRIELFLIKFNQ